MSNSQLNKLKSRIRNGIEITLNLSSNTIGHCHDETNLRHKLISTDEQVSRIHKAFANSSSANIKFLKNQLSRKV